MNTPPIFGVTTPQVPDAKTQVSAIQKQQDTAMVTNRARDILEDAVPDQLEYRMTVTYHDPAPDDFYVDFTDPDLAMKTYNIIAAQVNSGLIVKHVALEVRQVTEFAVMRSRGLAE